MRGQSKSTVSPCRDICEIDRVNRLCLGCFRSLEEIAKWSRYSVAERRKVLAALPNRKRAMKSGA